MTTEDFDFALWLQEFGLGATNKQAGEQLAALVTACRETGKAGSMTLTIKVDSGVSNTADLKTNIKTTVPHPTLPGGSYFVNEDGALVREDPRQLNLPEAKKLGVTPIRGRNDKGDAS